MTFQTACETLTIAPEDHVLVDEPKAAPKKTPTKRRTTANKARKTENK